MAVVLGTAGHIDHGKTSLVRALTGIDCDRLQEEKRRGITIELGFAWVDLPGGERLPQPVEAGERGDHIAIGRGERAAQRGNVRVVRLRQVGI